MDSTAAICVYQDVNMYVSELDKDKSLAFMLAPSRQLYIKVMEGEADVNGVVFKAGDAAKASMKT